MTDAELPEVLTLREIADRERVSVDAVLRWAVVGDLPAYRVGRLWRVRREDYLAFRRPNVQPRRGRQREANEYLATLGL